MINSDRYLTLKILTPEGVLLSEENLLNVRVLLADGGPIGIRPRHAPLIAETVSGPVEYQDQQTRKSIEIHAGVLNIREDLITILTPGEISPTSPELMEPSDSTYDRLMTTLISSLEPKHDGIEVTDEN